MSANPSAEADEPELDARAAPLEATSAAITATDLELGRCRLRYLVAQGGMASVYLAQLAGAAGFERWVAVKVVHPHLANDQRFVRMLLDEARLTARIQHPNVCSVIDFGRDGSTCFLVMEYMHGESLASVLRRADRAQGMPWPLAVRVLVEGARGLHAAHELRDANGRPVGLVHRDVSPQNLFVLYEGVAKVLDFGVAQARDKLEKTASGEVKGKLAYMAPEQLLGQNVDRRTDVWALGVVLWEALAGRRLFRGKTDGETVQRVLNAEIPRPSRAGSRMAVPRDVDAIALKALQRDPAARYATAAELADALEDALHVNAARAGAKEIAAWMREVFADRRALREEMMRKQMPVGLVPEVELDTGHTKVTPAGEQAPQVQPPSSGLDSSSIRVATGGNAERTRVLRLAFAISAAVLLMAVTLAFGFHLGARGREPTADPGPPANELARLGPLVELSPTEGATVAAAAAAPTIEGSMPEAPAIEAPAIEAPAIEAPAIEAPPIEPRANEEPANEEPLVFELPASTEPASTAPASTESGPRSAEPVTTRVRPRPPRTTATTSGSASTGSLNVIAIPPAHIYLRGRLLGETPLRGVEVPAGVHELEARPLDGVGAVRRARVVVEAGETARIAIR